MSSLKSMVRLMRSEFAKNHAFVGVAMKLPDCDYPELIINGFPNFNAKAKFYEDSYNEDFTHQHVEGLKIVGLGFGDSVEEVEKNMKMFEATVDSE